MEASDQNGGQPDEGAKNERSLVPMCITPEWPEDKIRELTTMGNNGDKDAAAKLWNYYRESYNEGEKARYWRRKAAENGDVDAQLWIGMSLIDDPKTNDEGRYWLSMAAKADPSKEPSALRAKFELRLHLSDEDINILTKRANEGDIESFLILSIYYSKIEKNEKLSKYWSDRMYEFVNGVKRPEQSSFSNDTGIAR